MRNKKLIVIVIFCFIFVGIPIIIIYDGLHGNFIRDYFMEKRVKEHLMDNGYTEEEILSIEADYNMKFNTNRIKGTYAYVVFKDEPGEKYKYVQWRESGEVQQKCTYYSEKLGAYVDKYTDKRKHMIKNCY